MRGSRQPGERARNLPDCEACGAAQETHHRHDGDDAPTRNPVRAYASQADADAAGLERATDALRAKDLPRFVELLLAAETGTTPRASPTADGPGWLVAVRGALVFVTLRADDVLLEAPIARLPARQRLPALRLALELCARDAASSRVCARGDLLLLRLSARLAPLSPPVLRYHLREIGHLAARYAGLMTVTLDALPAFPDEQRGAVAFDAIARGRRIQLGAGHEGAPGGVRRGGPPPPPDAVAANGGRPRQRASIRPLPRDEDSMAPGLGTEAPIDSPPRPRAAAEARRPISDSSELGGGEGIPAILSPMFSESGSASRPTPRAPPSEPRAGLTQAEIDERHRRAQTTQTGTIPVAEGGRRPSSSSYDQPVVPRPQASDGGYAQKPQVRTEIEIDTVSRRPPSTSGVETSSIKPPSGSEPSLSATDRLCMLLRHAQSLASLTLEERPATMSWLVRSAVFRAIYDFKDLLPDAVAHLYRCTGVARDVPASPSPRVSGQHQATEPALVVMERVIVCRAQVQKEKPLAIEPMTSAAQAKEHVARYLLEIDRAPGDPPLRHFLALGALTELLVRTKLPPQTDQRLRDIVAHAQREGAKVPAIDLMMTALQRINS